MLKSVLFIILMFIYLYIIGNYSMRGLYRYDKNGKLIFYPLNNKKGYVIEDKSLIDKTCKSFKKLYYLNIKGYLKDIDDIFKNSEVTYEPLSYNERFTNIAKTYPLPILLLTLIINLLLIIYLYSQQQLIFAIIFIFPIVLNIKQIYIKTCK